MTSKLASIASLLIAARFDYALANRRNHQPAPPLRLRGSPSSGDGLSERGIERPLAVRAADNESSSIEQSIDRLPIKARQSKVVNQTSDRLSMSKERQSEESKIADSADTTLVATPSSSSENGIQPQLHQPTWTEILIEDFTFFASSIFQTDSSYVTYYPSSKNRKGVVRLQNDGLNLEGDYSAILYSGDISSTILTMDTDVSSTLSFKMESVEHIKVVFSYYANSMKTNDGFCLDYSTTAAADDDNDDWQSIKCWHGSSEQQDAEVFSSGVWYDDTSATFNLKSNADSFRIRFRSDDNSLNDDVFIDGVTILGLVESEVVKDLV